MYPIMWSLGEKTGLNEINIFNYSSLTFLSRLPKEIPFPLLSSPGHDQSRENLLYRMLNYMVNYRIFLKNKLFFFHEGKTRSFR